MHSNRSIISLFEQQVLLHPNKVAVTDTESSLSYSELNSKAELFSQMLQEHYDVLPGDRIALGISQKTPELLVAIMGILKAGAVYVAINPEYPQSIRDEILSTIEAKCYIAQGATDANCIDFDNLTQSLVRYQAKQSFKRVTHFEYAYAICTSGTTGKPKVILISHENVLATYYSWQSVFKLSHDDTHLQMANFSFDVFTGDWVRCLSSGGTLVLCQTQMLSQPERLYQIITDQRITIAEFVPATLSRLIDYLGNYQKQLTTFRILICGSDLWTVDEARKLLHSCSEGTELYNTYGLSEVTIDSTYFKITTASIASLEVGSLVPIGIPFPHVIVKVRDKNQNKIECNEVGELFVGGSGVSPCGYLGQSELTAERFVEDKESPGHILYCTKDQVLIMEDGNIAFLGRNEFQTNIDGKRVELSSVEHTLSTHSKVKSALVIADISNRNATRLNAYLLLNDTSLSYDELTTFLKDKLPLHYIPHLFFQIDHIPLTANGKVSRKISSMPVVAKISRDFFPPSNEVEKKLVTLWKDMLGVDNVGVTDYFRDLGGNSLLFVDMLEKVNHTFNVAVHPCMNLFSVRDIAQEVRHQTEANIIDTLEIPRDMISSYNYLSKQLPTKFFSSSMLFHHSKRYYSVFQKSPSCSPTLPARTSVRFLSPGMNIFQKSIKRTPTVIKAIATAGVGVAVRIYLSR